MAIGDGDYMVASNSIVGADTVPVFSSTHGSTRIRNREYIMDITTSSTPGQFSVTTMPINPSLAETFPWLSIIAQNFEQYRIHGMLFEFKTMSGDALTSTNTALGTVIMATQYNVYNPPFINKQFMENYEFSSSCKPSCSMLHPIECAQYETPTFCHFTRNDDVLALPAGDLRLYDMGNFSIATQGMQGTSVNVGELWVTYDIELIKPQQNENPLLLLDQYVASVSQVGTINTSNYFTTTPLLLAKTDLSNFGTSLPDSETILFPDWYTGNLLVQYYFAGTAVNGNLILPIISISGNVSQLDIFPTNTVVSGPNYPPSQSNLLTATYVSPKYYFNIALSVVAGPVNKLSLAGGDISGITNITGMTLIISSLPRYGNGIVTLPFP